MALSLAQAVVSNTSTTTSVTATLGSTPTSGNLLVAVVMNNGTVVPTMTGSWSQAQTKAYGAASVDSNTIFYRIAGAAEPTAVTANATGASLMDLHVYEIDGASPTLGTVLDKLAAGVDSGSTVSSEACGTTATLSQASEICFAAAAQNSANGGAGGTPWTNGFGSGVTTARLMSSFLIVSATTAVSTTASWTTARRAIGQIATFKANTAAAISDTQTSTQSDSTLAIALPATDTSTQSDGVALAQPDTDSITGSDSVAIAPATSDAIGLTEAVSIAVAVAGPDTLTQGDSPALAPSTTDSATVSESPAIALPDGDTASATDSPALALPQSDAVSQADTPSLAASPATTDTGTLAETGSNTGSDSITLAEGYGQGAVFTDTFGSGDFSKWDSTTTSLTGVAQVLGTEEDHDLNARFSVSPSGVAADTAYVTKAIVLTGSELWFSCRIRFDTYTQPTSGIAALSDLIAFDDASNGSHYAYSIQDTFSTTPGQAIIGASNVGGGRFNIPAIGTWHTFKVHIVGIGGTVVTGTFLLDGVPTTAPRVSAMSVANSVMPTRLRLGIHNQGSQDGVIDVRFDSIVLSTSDPDAGVAATPVTTDSGAVADTPALALVGVDAASLTETTAIAIAVADGVALAEHYGQDQLFSDDFEDGSFGRWTSVNTNLTGVAEVLASEPKTGGYSAHFSTNPTGSNNDYAYARQTIVATGTDLWVRASIQIDSFTVGADNTLMDSLIFLGNTGSNLQVDLIPITDGSHFSTRLYVGGASAGFVLGFTNLALGTYHTIVLHLNLAANPPTVTIWADGANKGTFAAPAGFAANYVMPTFVAVGLYGGAGHNSTTIVDLRVDDVTISTADPASGLTAAPSSTDSAGVTEVPALASSPTDAATIGESGVIGVALAQADAGSQSDQGALALTSTDATTLTDVPSLALAGPDAGTLGEAPAIGLTGADSLALAEATAISTPISSADTFSETEGPALAPALADALGMAEAGSLGASVSTSDATAATDTPALSLIDADSLTGTESPAIALTGLEAATLAAAPALALIGQDSSSLADLPAIALADADLSTGSESPGIALVGSDALAADEAARVEFGNLPVSATDSLALNETGEIASSLDDRDSPVASELLDIALARAELVATDDRSGLGLLDRDSLAQRDQISLAVDLTDRDTGLAGETPEISVVQDDLVLHDDQESLRATPDDREDLVVSEATKLAPATADDGLAQELVALQATPVARDQITLTEDQAIAVTGNQAVGAADSLGLGEQVSIAVALVAPDAGVLGEQPGFRVVALDTGAATEEAGLGLIDQDAVTSGEGFALGLGVAETVVVGESPALAAALNDADVVDEFASLRLALAGAETLTIADLLGLAAGTTGNDRAGLTDIPGVGVGTGDRAGLAESTGVALPIVGSDLGSLVESARIGLARSEGFTLAELGVVLALTEQPGYTTPADSPATRATPDDRLVGLVRTTNALATEPVLADRADYCTLDDRLADASLVGDVI